MKYAGLGLCVALLLPLINSAVAATVLHYDATLTPDLAQQSIVGKVTITLTTDSSADTTLASAINQALAHQIARQSPPHQTDIPDYTYRL